MAGGGDYNYGRTPAGYTLYERYALGWAHPKTITQAGNYAMEAVNVSNDGYILRSPVSNEFFTIENRQRTRWDAYIPGHGMIVTRVDSTNLGVWSNNKVNCNPSHNYFEMLRAGNTSSGDNASDAFPGTMGIPMITNESLPNLRTWDGSANSFNIVDINEKDGIISFKVVDNNSQLKLVEDFEGMTANGSTTDQNVEGKFANWSFNKAGVRSPGEGKADGTNSVMMKLPSQFYTVTPINYNTNMATLTIFNTGAYVAKYSLDYSTDGGETWTRALTSAGNASVDVPARTSSIGYWPLKISSKKSALYRISQVGGNKNASTYVDNFTLYNTENVDYLFGDVNGDGEVNIMDINAIINIILGGNVDDDTRARADLTADGEVTISDINVLVSILIQ